MNNKKKCFVIMPFSDTQSCTGQEWTGIFKGIIKPAVDESGLGYECERSVAERENIIKGILEALNKANVVIADLTDNNPNVFYELGVRHTLTNRTILIAQGEKHIPFDLKPYPTTFYSKSLINIEEFKNDIKKKLEDIETNPERADNPVADFLQLKNIDILTYEKSVNLKKLDALLSELSSNMRASGKILSQIKEAREERKKGAMGPWATTMRLSNSSLQLLLTTRYVLPPQKLLRTIDLTNHEINLINTLLDLRPVLGEDVEKTLVEVLPGTEDSLGDLMKFMSQFTAEYASDNYQEPETPAIILASTEHEKYLKQLG